MFANRFILNRLIAATIIAIISSEITKLTKPLYRNSALQLGQMIVTPKP
ncbi:MAG: hypothetical protein LLG40_09770 [Deltaproteobacteria bacterium]|nr:hypothetical protein [Deltaproteobacteria bacterium]